MSGEELRIIRNYSNKTQEEFAQLLGVGAPYLSQMECGHRLVSRRVKVQLAKHFEVSPEYLDTLKNFKGFFADNI